MKIKLNNDKLLEFYQFIVTHYVLDDNKNLSTPSGAIYNFHPKFFYKKEVVDTFFSYMIWRNQNEKSIQEKKLDKISKYLKHKDSVETFQYLMELGSVNDITNKLTYFEEFYGLSDEN